MVSLSTERLKDHLMSELLTEECPPKKIIFRNANLMYSNLDFVIF